MRRKPVPEEPVDFIEQAHRRAMERHGLAEPEPEPEETLEERLDKYGLALNQPFRTQVSRLSVMFRLDANEIATILGVEQARVETEIRSLNDIWRQAGSKSSEADRQLDRGRTIMELETLKEDLAVEHKKTGDSKYLTLRVNVIERLTKLRGLEHEKGSEDESAAMSGGAKLANAIAALPAAKLAKLRKLIAVP